jgi:hypothetical protein
MSEHKAPLPPGPRKDTRTINRRASVRFPCTPKHPREAAVVCGETSRHALVLDVSLGGVGLLLSGPIEPDTPVRIRLSASLPRGPLELSARVAHATPREDGYWLVGCALDRSLTREELRALLA